MKSFLLGVVVTGALFALASFALHDSAARAASVPGSTTGPLALSQLTLDRAFRVPVVLGSGGNGTSMTVTIPSNAGFVLTEVRCAHDACSITFDVNGAAESFGFFGGTGANPGYTASGTHRLSPPLIVPPGALFTVTGTGGNGANPTTYTLSGYVIYPGEV